MKAVLMTRPGGPDVLSFKDIPQPTIDSETEVLVQLHGAGINPVDAKQRGRGTWYPGELPAILGIDGAGVVVETGPAAEKFKKGDEVYFAHGGVGKEPGNYAEYAVLEERFLARKPDALSFAEAAAGPSVLITAWDSLFHLGNLQKGQSVLIHAGAGGVGHVAIQLAKLTGARVCTTVADDGQAAFVKQLGIEKAIPYQEQDFVQEVLEWTDGQGVDLAVDMVGKETFFKTFSAVRPYGQVVALLGPDPEFADWQEARLKNLTISYELMLGPMYYNLVDHQIRQTKVLTDCANWLNEQELKLHVSQTFPLKDAPEAHRAIEKGNTQGKIVLLQYA